MEIVPFFGNNGDMVVESWEEQRQQREQALIAHHEAEQKVFQETNTTIVEYRKALNNAMSSGDALAVTSQLSDMLEGNINRLMALEMQQYMGEQIAYTEESIQGRVLLQSLRDNTQLFYNAQEQLITAIADKNTIANEKNTLATELENTKQLVLYKEDELKLKTNEYQVASVDLVNQITRLNNELGEVIKTSSALQPTQQQLALVSSEKENLDLQLNNLLQAYNTEQNSAKQKDEYYKGVLSRLETEKNNTANTREKELALFETFRKDALERIANAEENAKKIVTDTKQLALTQVNAIEEDKKQYFAQLNKLQEEVRQKQSELTVVQTQFEFLKNTERQLNTERDELSRLLTRARQDKQTQEANLRAAQQIAQEKSLQSQSLYAKVKELEAASRLALTSVENESVDQQLALQNEEIEKMRQQLIAFQSRLIRAQQEIADAERKDKGNLEKIDSLVKINAAIRETQEKINESNKKQREVEDKERARLLSDITRLTQEVDIVKAGMSKQSQLIAISQNDEEEKLRKELENARNKNRDDVVKITTLERTIQEKERALTLVSSNLDQVELERELLSVETALKNEQTRVTQLEIKLAGAQTRINDDELLNKERQALYDARKKELERAQKRFVEATNDAQKLESQKSELNRQLSNIDNGLNRIQLYELRDDQLRALKMKFDVNDVDNSELIRSTKSIRSQLEDAISHTKSLNAMEVFTGASSYRKVDKSDLHVLGKYVLATKFLLNRAIATTSTTSTTHTTSTTGTTTTSTSKRKPIIALGASALHSLNQFEMIAQAEWLSLNRQLTEPGEYSVEVAFSMDMPDLSEHEEFHFLMRDVRLIANPNDTASGERFFVIDLTSPGNRVIYGLGSMGVADVIYGKGSVDIIVREKKNNVIVKEEKLAYEFVPQKNLQYNTKVSAGINNSVSMHARYLGSSYIIEDMLIRQ
jgi:hypothetical protein